MAEAARYGGRLLLEPRFTSEVSLMLGRTWLLGGLLALTLAGLASSARAEPATFCVKATKVTTTKPAHHTGGWNDKHCTEVNATHEGKWEKVTPSLSEEEQEELKALLKYVKVEASGVGGKPTVQFHDSNVQVVNGTGKTDSINGEGNLVVGYDENSEGHAQTGSHDLVLGYDQTFTSYGGIIAGFDNAITGPLSAVTAGNGNVASALGATVSGGGANTASADNASVSGGDNNVAGSSTASVSGGEGNRATGQHASVSGGYGGVAEFFGWIGGGYDNEAGGPAGAAGGSVSGGVSNKATAWASVTGGQLNEATGERAWIGGGEQNKATGKASSVFGGSYNRALAEDSAVAGGSTNTTTGGGTFIGGGYENTAGGILSSILGGKEQLATLEYQHLP